jgi:hypothetical protein
VVRRTQTVESTRPRRHPPMLHARAARRALSLSLRSAVVALSGPGLHDVGADLADPRAYVALDRLQGGEYHPHGRGCHEVIMM